MAGKEAEKNENTESTLATSKKFISAVTGVVLVIGEFILFRVVWDIPEAVQMLIPTTAALFGIHVISQGFADWGKEKEKISNSK